MGPAPTTTTTSTTSEVSRTRPAEPRSRGETVELSAFDDPCPGSFGTEQPEPAVHMAIHHYASRVGHFHTRHPKPAALTESTNWSDQIPIPETSPPVTLIIQVSPTNAYNVSST